MMTIPLDVLYEDNHLLALNKPCGVPSAHFDGETATLDLAVKDYLKQKYAKPGNVFLGIVHRLDKPTSGCLVFARTGKAAARLSEQFREHTVRKIYWAICDLAPFMQQPTGTLEDHLLHDDAAERVVVCSPEVMNAKYAKLNYRVLAKRHNKALLELTPLTGRKHQLRVQLASRGATIHGDAKYGSTHRFGVGIALHARSLSFKHPTLDQVIDLIAPVPDAWHGLFSPLLAEVT